MTSRLSFAISTASNAERGESADEPSVAADQQIEEEIAEIKRYEVCAPWFPMLGAGQLTIYAGFYDYRYRSLLDYVHVFFRKTHKRLQTGYKMLPENVYDARPAENKPLVSTKLANLTGDTRFGSHTRMPKDGSWSQLSAWPLASMPPS